MAELVREKPPSRLMLLDIRHERTQELDFDLPAEALSCQELKAALVYKGPLVSVAFYPYYRVSCRANIPAVCLADTLQAAGVKDNPLCAQLKRGPG